MLHDIIGNDCRPMSTKECKLDYESMIKSAREKLKKNEVLQDAIFSYVGNLILRGGLAEMVGKLVSEKRQIAADIDRMMADMENG